MSAPTVPITVAKPLGHTAAHPMRTRRRATIADLRQAIGVDLKGLEDQLENLGAPWTPGRLPSWKPE